MLKLKKIAVTGTLASGKTELAKILEASGAYRLDADKITHQLYLSNSSLKESIIKRFGASITTDGEIDRKKLATLVFKDQEKLAELESLVHPLILKKILNDAERLEKEGKARCLVVEIPLLFELGWESYFDTILVVGADVKNCLKRYLNSGHTEEDFVRRSKAQWPFNKKASKAHFVLHNNGDINHLKMEIMTLLKNLGERFQL
ncbi:MAG: dephospho-CoA kinase [Simkaniaceae bacterium]